MAKASSNLAGCPKERERMKTITELINNLKIGKRTRSSVYVHESVFDQLEELKTLLMYRQPQENVVKFSRTKPQLSFLSYPGFLKDAFPELKRSKHFNLETLEITERSYKKNPPVLHRKELMMDFNHPMYLKFAKLTQDLEEAGLFGKDIYKMGYKNHWNHHLKTNGFEVKGHSLRKVR